MGMAGAKPWFLWSRSGQNTRVHCRQHLSWMDAGAEVSWEQLLFFCVVWRLRIWNRRGNVERSLWTTELTAWAVWLRQVPVGKEGAVFKCTMAGSSSALSLGAFWKVWPQNLVTEDRAVLKEEQKPRCMLTWEAAPFSWKNKWSRVQLM